MIRSLRGRLLLRLVVGASVLLAIGGVLLVRSVEGRARRDFDRALEDRARALSSLAEEEDGKVWLEFDPVAFPEFFPGSTADYFELRDAVGATLIASASSSGRRLPLPDSLPGEVNPRLVDLQLFDGRAGRAVLYRFAPRLESEEEGASEVGSDDRYRMPSPPAAETGAAGREVPHMATILVARERGSLERFVARTRSAVLTFSVGLVIALSGLIFWAVYGELRRVRELAKRMSEVDAGTLDRPIGQLELPTELQPIATRLDELLSRLHVSFERERAFSSQLAHELRTPLAELRSTVDVALRWPEGAQHLSEALREVGQIGHQMERVLRNLLAIARADAGIEPLHLAPVQLGAVVQEAFDASCAVLDQRGVELRVRIDPSVSVQASSAVLELILGNLVANAAEYSTAGSWVEVDYDAATSVLRMRNPAPDLDARDAAHLFERFWRKSVGREVGEHSGLGLSLVRSLARRMGGEATVELSDGLLAISISGLPIATARDGSWRDPVDFGRSS